MLKPCLPEIFGLALAASWLTPAARGGWKAAGALVDQHHRQYAGVHVDQQVR